MITLMKYQPWMIILVLISELSFGQESERVPTHYTVKGITEVRAYDTTTQKINETADEISLVYWGSAFEVFQKKEENGTSFSILQFYSIEEEPGGDSLFLTKDANQKGYYYIRSADLMNSENIEPRYPFKVDFTFGGLTLPLKLRPSTELDGENIPRRLTTNLSIGGYGGLRFRLRDKKETYITIPFLLGPSFIEVNDGNLEEPTGMEPENKEGIIVGLTGAVGIVYNIKKTQIGFIIGKDYTFGETGEDWIYDGKTWYSFGIGVSFTQK